MGANDGEWLHIHQFETEADAISYCRAKFGADSKGRVNLVTPMD